MLLKAQPQRGSQSHTTQGTVLYKQSAGPRHNQQAGKGAPHIRGIQQLSHQSPNNPTNIAALQKSSPSQEEGEKETEHDNKILRATVSGN